MSNPWATPEQLKTGTDPELNDLQRILKAEIRDRENDDKIQKQIDKLDEQIARFEARKQELEGQL